MFLIRTAREEPNSTNHMIHLSSFEAFLSSSSLVYQSALFVVSLAQQYQSTASLYNLLFSRPFPMRFHYIYWKAQSEVSTLILALTEQVSLLPGSSGYLLLCLMMLWCWDASLVWLQCSCLVCVSFKIPKTLSL